MFKSALPKIALAALAILGCFSAWYKFATNDEANAVIIENKAPKALKNIRLYYTSAIRTLPIINANTKTKVRLTGLRGESSGLMMKFEDFNQKEHSEYFPCYMEGNSSQTISVTIDANDKASWSSDWSRR